MIKRIGVIAVLGSIAAYQDVDVGYLILIIGLPLSVIVDILLFSKRKPPGKL